MTAASPGFGVSLIGSPSFQSPNHVYFGDHVSQLVWFSSLLSPTPCLTFSSVPIAAIGLAPEFTVLYSAVAVF